MFTPDWMPHKMHLTDKTQNTHRKFNMFHYILSDLWSNVKCPLGNLYRTQMVHSFLHFDHLKSLYKTIWLRYQICKLSNAWGQSACLKQMSMVHTYFLHCKACNFWMVLNWFFWLWFTKPMQFRYFHIRHIGTSADSTEFNEIFCLFLTIRMYIIECYVVLCCILPYLSKPNDYISNGVNNVSRIQLWVVSCLYNQKIIII